MNAKKLLKPNALCISLALLGISLYFVKEEICAAGGFIFVFCYKAYGWPFAYLITGDIGNASGHIKTLFLGDYFAQYGNLLFNPAAFVLNAFLIYLSTYLISILVKLRIKL